MASLGNRTFTGLVDGQKDADLLRRLNDLSSTAYGNQDTLTSVQQAIAALKASQLTVAQVTALLQSPTIVKNVTNAIGIVGTPQPASIATVKTLPSAVSGLQIGQAVIYQSQLYTWSGTKWVQGVIAVYVDTHANRLANYPPANYPLGTVFIESDRHVTYEIQFDSITTMANQWYYASGEYIAPSANRPTLGQYEDGYPFTSTDHFIRWRYYWASGVPYWLYIGGEDNGTLANLPNAGGIAGGPTANDIGLPYGATDVGHRFMWNGTAFTFAPGDPGSGWTTFTPSLEENPGSSVFVPIGAGGATLTNITTPSGGQTSISYGAWVSPITGATLWARI